MELYTRVFCQDCLAVNKKIQQGFSLLTEGDFREQTHFFHVRYENIYLDVNKLPELDIIANNALKNAANILNVKQENLQSGFWLNAMAAGDVTTAHTHDDDDELLSCVYYIRVPENSGDLIITENNNKTVIKAEEGMFVFFSPKTLHEVSENKSDQSRLSMAFNFGLI